MEKKSYVLLQLNAVMRNDDNDPGLIVANSGLILHNVVESYFGKEENKKFNFVDQNKDTDHLVRTDWYLHNPRLEFTMDAIIMDCFQQCIGRGVIDNKEIFEDVTEENDLLANRDFLDNLWIHMVVRESFHHRSGRRHVVIEKIDGFIHYDREGRGISYIYNPELNHLTVNVGCHRNK